MTWLIRAGEIAGALSAIIGTVILLRTKIIGPIRRGWAELIALLQRLLTATRAVEGFGHRIEELAGAFTVFAVGIKEQVDRNTERIERLEDMREMVVDLDAALQRLRRIHPRDDHQETP